MRPALRTRRRRRALFRALRVGAGAARSYYPFGPVPHRPLARQPSARCASLDQHTHSAQGIVAAQPCPWSSEPAIRSQARKSCKSRRTKRADGPDRRATRCLVRRWTRFVRSRSQRAFARAYPVGQTKACLAGRWRLVSRRNSPRRPCCASPHNRCDDPAPSRPGESRHGRAPGGMIVADEMGRN